MTTLVSFPRTGSHWLRVALAAYTGGQAELVHTHDMDLTLDADDVIYLWREDWVAVIWSQMEYERLPRAYEPMRQVAIAYGEHLRHWLPRASLVVTYEQMERQLGRTLAQVARHLDVKRVDGGAAAAKAITRQDVADSRPEDPRVVNVTPEYVMGREAFRVRAGAVIDRFMRAYGP